MSLHLRTTPARRADRPRRIPLTRLPRPAPDRLVPTWEAASPRRIADALDRATARDAGGWFVVATSRDVGTARTITRVVDGREVALWRGSDGAVIAGPGACPHLGALLDRCPVAGGVAHCRWHGLSLGADGRPGWTPFPAHDDGLLVWVRLPVPGETPSERPVPSARPAPAESLSAVIAPVGVCEPVDVIANRLDPWHGAWFHPYAFSHLVVDEAVSTPDRLVVDVAFRLNRTWGVPVRAEFVCPDSRTVVMRIIDGEGAGSVVETHATPLGPGDDGRQRTMVIEATVAHSDRRGFRFARPASALIAPAMRRSARRLWVDDLAYAERRYELRRRG